MLFFSAGAFFAWAVIYLAEGNAPKFWNYVGWLIAALGFGVISALQQ